MDTGNKVNMKETKEGEKITEAKEGFLQKNSMTRFVFVLL